MICSIYYNGGHYYLLNTITLVLYFHPFPFPHDDSEMSTTFDPVQSMNGLHANFLL